MYCPFRGRVEAHTKVRLATRTEKEVLAQVLEAGRMLGLTLQRRNTGAGVNPQGRMVRFGSPGDADLDGVLSDGRAIRVEVKHEGFDPSKLRGAKREHFERQLDKLKHVNENNGIGCWVSDSSQLFHLMRRIKEGWRVEFDDAGFPWLVSPDEAGKSRA